MVRSRVEGVASRIAGEKDERSSASELVNVRFSQIRSETMAPLGPPVPLFFFFFFFTTFRLLCSPPKTGQTREYKGRRAEQ